MAFFNIYSIINEINSKVKLVVRVKIFKLTGPRLQKMNNLKILENLVEKCFLIKKYTTDSRAHAPGKESEPT